MKIKIELTKSEASKIKKVALNVSEQLYVCSDEEFDKETRDSYVEGIDKVIYNTSEKNKYISYKSEEQDNGASEINIELKTKFVTDLLNIVDIFYVYIAKFINNVKKPVIDFVEKYLY